MTMHLNRSDRTGPWKPNKVSMQLYAEAQYIAKESYSRTYFRGLACNEALFASHIAKYMGYIDKAKSVADQAISDMIFGDTHKT